MCSLLLNACRGTGSAPPTSSSTPHVGSTYKEVPYYLSDEGVIDSTSSQPDSIVVVENSDTTILGSPHAIRFVRYTFLDSTRTTKQLSSELDLHPLENGDLQLLDRGPRLPITVWHTLPIQTKKVSKIEIDTIVPLGDNSLHLKGSSTATYGGVAELPFQGSTIHTIITTDTLQLEATIPSSHGSIEILSTYYYAPSIGYFVKRRSIVDLIDLEDQPVHLDQQWVLEHYSLK